MRAGRGGGSRLPAHLVGTRPLDLGAELLDGLVEAAVAAQVGLHGGQVHAPLGRPQPPLVLLHPRQQVLQVAQRGVVQLLPRPLPQRRGGLGGHRRPRLEAQVVLGADGHQALVQAVHPAVHLLPLRVPAVLQRLHVVEEHADHGIRLVQVPIDLSRLLRRLPRVQQPNVLGMGHGQGAAAPPRTVPCHPTPSRSSNSPTAAGCPPG